MNEPTNRIDTDADIGLLDAQGLVAAGSDMAVSGGSRC
jgi:hypothetical protein